MAMAMAPALRGKHVDGDGKTGKSRERRARLLFSPKSGVP